MLNHSIDDGSRNSQNFSGEPTGREIEKFLPLIKKIARPYRTRLPRALEIDDLISVGLMGLCDAKRRYDPFQNVAFENFAAYRIRGAMIDEIRNMSWVSRRTMDKIGLLQKTEKTLQQKYEHAPTNEQVADHLGVQVRWVDTIRQHQQKVSIQGFFLQPEDDFAGGDVERYGEETPVHAYEMKELSWVLQDAVQALPAKDSEVMAQYYFMEKPMKAIGETMGLTESRISQIHSRALDKIRSSPWRDSLRSFWGPRTKQGEST